MKIVAVVAIGIVTNQMGSRQVLLIGVRRLCISHSRVVILPDACIDMSRHVNQVASARHETR